MSDEKIRRYGDELYDALVTRTPVAPLTDRDPTLTIEDAYRIQLHMVERRVLAGETIIGKKIGATSKPVQVRLGVHQPDFGQLTSGMAHREGDAIDLSGLIQPLVEAELAFVLKEDLNGPGITAMDVIRATDYVVPDCPGARVVRDDCCTYIEFSAAKLLEGRYDCADAPPYGFRLQVQPSIQVSTFSYPV